MPGGRKTWKSGVMADWEVTNSGQEKDSGCEPGAGEEQGQSGELRGLVGEAVGFGGPAEWRTSHSTKEVEKMIKI